MDTPELSLLDKLREQRTAALNDWAARIEARDAERSAFEARTDATDEERSAFNAAEEAFGAESDRNEAALKALDKRIREQKTVERRRKVAEKAARSTAGGGTVRVNAEPLTYRADNTGEHSYFADLACALNSQAAGSFNHRQPSDAIDRLRRHASEMEIERPKREEQREKRARRQIEDAEGREFRGDPFHRGQVVSPFEHRTAPNRTTGQGGYFVPPLWLDEWIPGLRAGRVTAGLCRSMDLPSGTDSINIPKLANLTTVAIQGADAAPVAQTDWSDTAVTANVKTLAGQSDIAIQLLDQSPYPVDQVILQDLMADYNQKLDLQVVQGNGSASTPLNGGQVQGLYSSAGASSWASYNGVTYTDGSPAPWKFLSVAGAMASNIAKTRFQLGSSFAVVAHPRRAFWYAAGTDSNNRPLVEPTNFGPFNVAAIEVDSVPAEGLVARLPWGPPIYQDPNIPIGDTAGGGTNQDVAIGALFDDCWLFEGEMRTRVLPELLSGTLQVRFQVYTYLAFLVRYGQSLAIASGSGFAAPTGAVSSITY